MYFTVCQERFVTFLVVTLWEWVRESSDEWRQRGGGPKMLFFCGEIIFEWPSIFLSDKTLMHEPLVF